LSLITLPKDSATRNFSCKLRLLDVFWNNLLFGLEQEEEDLFVVVEFWELVDEVAVQK
jgi:hypothetical protein